MNSNLLKLGWNETFQRQLESCSQPNSIPARITREDRGRYRVHKGDGLIYVQMSGSLLKAVQSPIDQPAIGDWVLIDPIENSQEYVINCVLERKSLFTRQTAGKASDKQLIASNIDYLFIIAGLDQDFNPRRIQRYLAQAWNSGAQPVIILNKSDLVENLGEIMEDLSIQIPDTPIHAVSALFRKKLDCLNPYLKSGMTIALSGSSGVGKSSLINALLGEQRLPTQSNRANDNRGRHTTSWRELIILDSGPCVIDLPGMRELQLTGDQFGILKAFSDIEQLARQCRFRNCGHQEEPGCAIQNALDSGELPPKRFEQYTKLKREISTARKRGKIRKPIITSKANKREEKESFFKDVAIRKRKIDKAKRKFREQDGL